MGTYLNSDLSGVPFLHGVKQGSYMVHRCTMCDVELPFPPWGESGREQTLEYCIRCECQFGYDDTQVSGVLQCRLRCLAEMPQWYYSVNDMGDVCMAVPAISGAVLFVRSQHFLFALGRKQSAK